jgi:hypothetical protein
MITPRMTPCSPGSKNEVGFIIHMRRNGIHPKIGLEGGFYVLLIHLTIEGISDIMG